MTSVGSSVKVNNADIGFYINVGSLLGQVYSLNTVAGGPSLSTATWSYWLSSPQTLSSLINPGRAVLKDMGKTVTSSLRTFRKVQLVYNSTISTFGVGGRAASLGDDYYTGYIELGFEGNGNPAPVAHFGR
jgi:hypothetical protein